MIVIVKGNDDDLSIAVSLALGISSLTDGDQNVEKGHAWLLNK